MSCQGSPGSDGCTWHKVVITGLQSADDPRGQLNLAPDAGFRLNMAARGNGHIDRIAEVGVAEEYEIDSVYHLLLVR